LCVYREVKLIKETAAVAKRKPSDAVAILFYDKKPGIQAIANTAPDLPPEPARTRPSRAITKPYFPALFCFCRCATLCGGSDVPISLAASSDIGRRSSASHQLAARVPV
jgi:hypothetical protein